MQQDISKIYNFIARLILMLEEELDELKAKRTKSAINVQKNITDILNKLVTLITQLNKLSKSDRQKVPGPMSEIDKQIIDSFIEKYVGMSSRA